MIRATLTMVSLNILKAKENKRCKILISLILAWMETVAVNFHDESGESVGKLNFEAGDDAVGVKWIDVSKDVKLYASHSRLIEATAQLRNAHF